MSGALQGLNKRFKEADAPAVDAPRGITFREFLLNHAQVKLADGRYGRYSFEGRPALEWIVERIDVILGNTGGKPITDAVLDIGGGAQWGKTVLVLLLLAYLLGIKFLNVGYYLPDDDLVEGIVDTKFRPDVVDQIPWMSDLIKIGKTINKSGRAVNRKGAISLTDGQRKSQGYIRGMGKIPTTFSMEVTIVDERDDVSEKNVKFLPGRMTAGQLRFRLNVGTMRYSGAGQNAEVRKGTFHVCMHTCAACGHTINYEEAFPGVIRLQKGTRPVWSDPQLTKAGVFQDGDSQIRYKPDQGWYLACPECGKYIDRDGISKDDWKAKQPENAEYNHWSIRVAQLATPAIPLKVIIADYCTNAIMDKAAMRALSVDRLALPASDEQKLDEEKLNRARELESYSMSIAPREDCVRYGGIDTGDRCWLVAREIESPVVKRIAWMEQIAPEQLRTRVPQLFDALGLSCVFIDIGNERFLARELCLIMNGIDTVINDDPKQNRIDFGNDLVWDPKKGWSGLKCAAVEFSLKPGGGIIHDIRSTQAGLFYPVIKTERNESIQGVIDEFLTVDDGLIDIIEDESGNKSARDFSIFRLPAKDPGSPDIIRAYDSHLLTGSRKEKESDGKEATFIQHVENHLLLATTYAKLAETVQGRTITTRFSFKSMVARIKAQRKRPRV